MKHAVLLDGGFVKPLFRKAFGRRIEARDVLALAHSLSRTHSANHDLLRIYYYDSPSLEAKVTKPISNTTLNFKSGEVYDHQLRLFRELKCSDFVSVREGTLAFRGWKLKRTALNALRKQGGDSPTFTDDSFEPNIQQKGVDTKLGLDMAWIAFNSVVDRVILVTGDSDFVPAIRAARRNGVQVILSTLNHGIVESLRNNADVIDESEIPQLMTPAS